MNEMQQKNQPNKMRQRSQSIEPRTPIPIRHATLQKNSTGKGHARMKSDVVDAKNKSYPSIPKLPTEKL